MVGAILFCDMTSPFAAQFGGTASFPISEQDCGDPDLAAAANALWFSSDNSRPVTSFVAGYPWPGEGGTAPLVLAGFDSPDGAELANYLAGFTGAPATEAGTYVNPQNTNSPDAILALDFLVDIL